MVLIDPVLSSSGVIASSPNRSLKGVKHVDLETVVLWLHTTLINSSGHFPLGWLKINFIISVIIIPFAVSTSPFDSECLTDAKWICVPIRSQKSLNVSTSNCVPLSTVLLSAHRSGKQCFAKRIYVLWSKLLWLKVLLQST